MKGDRKCLTCPLPDYQDQGYLAWFSPDELYTVLNNVEMNLTLQLLLQKHFL